MILALPVVLLFSLTISLGVYLVFQAKGDQSVLSTTLPALVVYVIILNHAILFALVLWFMRLDGLKRFDIGATSGNGIAIEVAIGLTSGAVIFLAQRYMFEPLIDILRADANTYRVAPASSPLGTSILPSLIAGVLAGGLVEEVLFRGYALRRLTERMSIWVAVPVMLLFFAVLHIGLGIVGIAIAAINGLLLTLLFLWRGSLIAPILAHASVNAIILLL
ncbi:MAG: CPBP family intramembrane metalloprotease [Hyphomonadaceae bacterium]|nr:CPBP family intramembrane metalloprotease [Hyphomonadaceae bacterium]